jgi:hypothetical protein
MIRGVVGDSVVGRRAGFRGALLSSTGSGASLDLNFLAGALDGRITVTRSGTATRFNASGQLESVAANTARINYDRATLQCLGLLVEESRTNSLRNSVASGGTAGSPGTAPTGYNLFSGSGLSREVDYGTEFGMPYIQVRLFGTASAGIAGVVTGFVGSGDIAAASGQTWTGSVYARQTAGTFRAINLTVTERGAGGELLASTGPTFTPTASYERQTATRTFNNASTALATLEMRFNMTSGETIDATYRFAIPQVEQGAWASSPILTNGAAVTRAVDHVTMPLDGWFNPLAGTIYADFTPIGVGTGLQTAVYFDDGTSNERMGIRTSVSAQAFLAVDNSAVQAQTTIGSLVAGAATRAAFAFAANDLAGAQNGDVTSTDPTGTLPTVTRLLIGTRLAGSEAMNAQYRKVRFWGVRRPNAELASITA